MNDDKLSHIGVKGMRWGHRKDRTKGGDKPKKLSKGEVKSLSDAELKVIVERMNLEQRYSKLAAETSTTSRGQKLAKFAGDIVVNSAKTAITAELTKQFQSGLVKSIKP